MAAGYRLCERCESGREPFEPTPDTLEWVQWKLTDPSWQRWRDENPEEVKKLESIGYDPREKGKNAHP